MEERERRLQEEAQQRLQRQAELEQQLREQQQMAQQQQMMSWFMNQALLASPPGSLPTPPFAFS
jgi:hypothetical protein